MGHTSIPRHDGLLKSIVESVTQKLKGERERPRSKYIRQVLKDVGMRSNRELKDLSIDREARRAATGYSIIERLRIRRLFIFSRISFSINNVQLCQ